MTYLCVYIKYVIYQRNYMQIDLMTSTKILSWSRRTLNIACSTQLNQLQTACLGAFLIQIQSSDPPKNIR